MGRKGPGRRAVLLGALGGLGGLEVLGGCGPAPTAGPAPTVTRSAPPSPAPVPSPTPSDAPAPTPIAAPGPPWAVAEVPSRATMTTAYAARSPREWGLAVTGVISRLERPAGIALTFDACGGSGGGSGYDEPLIDLLRQYGVKATLFLNRRWIEAHAVLAAELAADPLFEVESHGVRHLPLSVSGRSAYGIAGTRDIGEAYDEVVAANDWFLATLGRTPWFFRPGTAYADEVSAAMAREVGQVVTGFSVNADAGATSAPARVAAELDAAGPGDIVIGHMNRPGRGTAAGCAEAIPRLLERGVEFVHLVDGF